MLDNTNMGVEDGRPNYSHILQGIQRLVLNYYLYDLLPRNSFMSDIIGLVANDVNVLILVLLFHHDTKSHLSQISI